MCIFKPDLYFEKISDIDLKALVQKGIKALLVDIDNTLVPHNHPDFGEEVKNFIKDVYDAGIKVCIVSNNSRERAESFANRLGVPFVYKAKKPLAIGYKRAMRLLGTEKCKTATVGDQIFTDIAGGRMLGILTIMVKPISQQGETGFIRFKRILEKPFVKKYY